MYIVQSAQNMFDESPGLKTSTCQYSVIVTAPPTDKKSADLHEIYMVWPTHDIQQQDI